MTSALAFPKPARQLSPEYLRWIRAKDCLVRSKECNWRIDPNHLQHVGASGSDFGAVPMCRKHHDQFHRLPLYEFEARHQINLWRECSFLLMQWISELTRQQ